jgi:hypothetical protein
MEPLFFPNVGNIAPSLKVTVFSAETEKSPGKNIIPEMGHVGIENNRESELNKNIEKLSRSNEK